MQTSQLNILISGVGRVNLFFKIGQFPTSLSLIFNTVIVNKYNLQMTGFELWISGVWSNHSTNWVRQLMFI